MLRDISVIILDYFFAVTSIPNEIFFSLPFLLHVAFFCAKPYNGINDLIFTMNLLRKKCK